MNPKSFTGRITLDTSHNHSIILLVHFQFLLIFLSISERDGDFISIKNILFSGYIKDMINLYYFIYFLLREHPGEKVLTAYF